MSSTRATGSRFLLVSRIALVVALTTFDGRPAATAEPRDISLSEQVSTRLIQLDVTVEGPEAVIRSLVKDDFEVEVTGVGPIRDFNLDRADQAATALPAPAGKEGEAPPPVPKEAPPPAAHYVFYIDQGQLTLEGRRRAFELARELIPKLIVGGSQAMLVSNGRSLATVVGFTADQQRLFDGLKRVEANVGEWDTYASLEDRRMEELLAANRLGLAIMTARAETMWTEEQWQVRRSLQRLVISLGRMSDLTGAKVFLYFADTMRQDPGNHYLRAASLASASTGARSRSRLEATPTPKFGDATDLVPFQQAMTAASAAGVRFYPIQAEGLINPPARTEAYSELGYFDAQGTLTSMALETGGRAFLNGVSGSKISDKIQADLASLYFISFNADLLPQDRALSVHVTMKRSGVRVRTRASIVVQSEPTLRAARLLAAFVSPDATGANLPIHVELIPTGYQDGKFAASVQVIAAGSPVNPATVDVATSLVSRAALQDSKSGRIVCNRSNVPIVFQQAMNFSTGPYELVAVVHDVTTDQLGSLRRESGWPDPDRADVTLTTFAMLQPAEAAFSKGGTAASHGNIAIPEELPARTDLPTAFVGLVCRSRDNAGVFRVERSVTGETQAPFPPIEIDLRKERCAQIQDLVPANGFGAGAFRYEVTVFKDTDRVGHGERKFVAARPPA